MYADLPTKTDPQFSGLFNWKNDAGTFGVMVQGFFEKRHLRRDGQELLGYEHDRGRQRRSRLAHPDLAGVAVSDLIGAALFEQERERKGGLIDVQFKPTDDLTLDLQCFMSNLDATNYNRNYLLWGTHFISSGAGQAPDPGYVVQQQHAGRGDVRRRRPATRYGVYDQISRPDESARSNYVQPRRAAARVNDALHVSGADRHVRRATARRRRRTCPRRDTGVGSGARATSCTASAAAPSFNSRHDRQLDAASRRHAGRFDWIFGARTSTWRTRRTGRKIDGDFDARRRRASRA